jgi:hypothetical protein
VNNFSITGLSGTAVINFSRIHFITPTWVTVPTNVSISCTFVFGI